MMIPSALYPRSRQPLFMQAAGQLRLKIERGDWPAGSQIPVIEALQREFELSRATIRQALELLEEEGLIARHRGRGTFVSAQLPERRSHVLPIRWDDLIASLETLKPALTGPADECDADSIGAVVAGRPAGRYARFQRIHSRGGEPYCLIDIHLRHDVFAQDSARFLARPVILMLANDYPDVIGAVRQRVTFSFADRVTAHALGIALGAPVVEMLRTVTDPSGGVVMNTYSRYPGEYVRLDVDFDVPQAGAGAPEAAGKRGRE